MVKIVRSQCLLKHQKGEPPSRTHTPEEIVCELFTLLNPGSKFAVFLESTKMMGASMASFRFIPSHRRFMMDYQGQQVQEGRKERKKQKTKERKGKRKKEQKRERKRERKE